MADIINLKTARKRRERAEKQAEAEANRAKFGQSKAMREKADKQAALERARLNGHQVEKPE